MTGRTTWWGKDAAWNRRELIVELGEEHGPAGPLVMDVLSCWAQEQRGGGHVRGGFRSLARETFSDAAAVRAIVDNAAAIGAIDELEIDEDGRRFTCRVSGWGADQARAQAAFRKQAQRASEAEEAEVREPAKGGSVPVESRSGHQPDQTRPDQEEKEKERERPKLVRFRGESLPSDVVDDAVSLLDVFNEVTGRQVGPWSRGGKPSSALKQVLGAVLSRPDVDRLRWEIGIRRIVEHPPAWLEGPVQVGHVFGERAAEWTLSAGDDSPTKAAGGRWAAWVDEHLPDVPAGFLRDMAIARAEVLASSGHEVTVEAIRSHLGRWARDDDREAAPA